MANVPAAAAPAPQQQQQPPCHRRAAAAPPGAQQALNALRQVQARLQLQDDTINAFPEREDEEAAPEEVIGRWV